MKYLVQLIGSASMAIGCENPNPFVGATSLLRHSDGSRLPVELIQSAVGGVLTTGPLEPIALADSQGQDPKPSTSNVARIDSSAPVLESKTGTVDVTNDSPETITMEFVVNEVRLPGSFVMQPQSHRAFVVPSGNGHWRAVSENLVGDGLNEIGTAKGEFGICPGGVASIECTMVSRIMSNCESRQSGPEADAVRFLVALKQAIKSNRYHTVDSMVRLPMRLSINPDFPEQTTTVRTAKEFASWGATIFSDKAFLAAAMRNPGDVRSGVADCSTADPNNDGCGATVDWCQGMKAITKNGKRIGISYTTEPCSDHARANVTIVLEPGPRGGLRLVSFDSQR